MLFKFLLLFGLVLVISCSSTTNNNVNPKSSTNINGIYSAKEAVVPGINFNPKSCTSSNPYEQRRCCGGVRRVAQQDCRNKYAAYYEIYTECYDAADQWFEKCANFNRKSE